MPTKNRIINKIPSVLLIKDISATTLSSGILLLTQFIIQIIVVRSFPKNEYGEYAFTFAIYSVLELLLIGYSSDLAISSTGSYFIEKDIKGAAKVINQLFKADLKLFLFGSIFGILIYILPIQIVNLNVEYFFVLSLSLVFQTGFNSLKSSLISSNMIIEQVKFEIVCIISMLLITLFFTFFYGIFGLVISYLVYHAVKFIISIFLLSKYFNVRFQFWDIIKSLDDFTIKKKVNFAFHAMLRNGLTNLSNQLDLILVGLFYKDPAIIAIYKVAKSVNNVPTKFTYPIWAALRGRMIEAYYKKDYERLNNLIIKPMIILGIGMFVVFLVLIFLADEIINILYGESYLQASVPFLILFFGGIFTQVVNNWYTFLIVVSKLQRINNILLIIQILALSTICYYISKFGFYYFTVGTVLIGIIFSLIQLAVYFKAIIKK